LRFFAANPDIDLSTTICNLKTTGSSPSGKKAGVPDCGKQPQYVAESWTSEIILKIGKPGKIASGIGGLQNVYTRSGARG
jgi:hypothetical protein